MKDQATVRSSRTRSNHLSRRSFLGVTTGLTSMLVLAACGQQATPSPQGSPTASASAPATAVPAAPSGTTPQPTVPAAGAGSATTTAPTATSKALGASAVPKAASHQLAKQELVIGVWQSPHAQATKRLAPLFTDLTGGNVTVQVDTPPDTNAEQAKALAMWQAHGGDWDVVHLQNYNAPRYGEAGFFVPLTPELDKADLVNADAYNVKDFAPAIIDSYEYKNQILAFPFEASTLMTFARKDLLQEYGGKEPPIDGYAWEDLRDLGKTIQEKINTKGVKNLYAVAYEMQASQAGITYEQAVRGFGLNPFTNDEKPQPQFNHDLAVEAIQLLHDFAFKDKIASPGVAGYGYAEMVEVINHTQAVIPLQWNASAETNEVAGKSESAGKLVYAAFPYSQKAGKDAKRVRNNSHGYGVNPWSKKRDAALEFVFWYTSPDVARDYVTNGGGTSGRSSLLHDPSIVAKHPWYPAMFRGYELFYAYPSTPNYTYLINNILAKNLTAVWAGQMTVKQGLDKSQDDAVAYLKQTAS